MTNKIYKTAQGQTIDLGAIVLQNEHVRAVGNMNVNARGDILDGSSRVIEQRNQQVARQMQNTTQAAPTAVSNKPIHTSTVAARRNREQALAVDTAPDGDTAPTADLADDTTSADTASIDSTDTVDTAPADAAPLTGLAAAMARSRTVTQERLKTPKEIAKNKPGVNKL